MGASAKTEALLDALRACIDEYEGHFRELRGARNLGEYLAAPAKGADEEVLTEPILRSMIERVLGFPRDAFFEQLGKHGRKPDFTPYDLVAHPFVLDSKSSTEDLGAHEPQIRGYMRQRDLDSGVLFNLREVRVYRKGAASNDPSLSFPVLHLWEQARGEALPSAELERFEAFCRRFGHRTLTVEQKVDEIASRESWALREARGDMLEVDVEFLVKRLRQLSVELAEDAAVQMDSLESFVRLNPGREQKLLAELELLALDLSPGVELESLPKQLSAWRTAERKPLRVLDFATGSGGFLVEAARRIVDDGEIDTGDPAALREALEAIVRGFVGGEISPFPTRSCPSFSSRSISTRFAGVGRGARPSCATSSPRAGGWSRRWSGSSAPSTTSRPS